MTRILHDVPGSELNTSRLILLTVVLLITVGVYLFAFSRIHRIAQKNKAEDSKVEDAEQKMQRAIEKYKAQEAFEEWAEEVGKNVQPQ